MAAVAPVAVAVEPQFVAGASLRSQMLAHTMRVAVKPVLDVWGRYPGPLWPAGLLDMSARILQPTRGVRKRRIRLDDCDAEWWQRGGPGVDSDGAPAGTAILYLHGGGFLTCGLNTHRILSLRIAAAADASVLSVDYRMLPRHPIADSIVDCVNGYRWLLDRGYPPDRIVVAGDSAGGFLTFATALALEGLGLAQPAALVALSPLTELDPANKLARREGAACPLIPRSVLLTLADIAGRADGPTPTVSPVDAVLAGLPPVLIQVGSTEMLYADAELMAQRLGAAGVPVTLEVWDRQVHVFQAAADILPEAARAVARIGEFVREATRASERPAAAG
ncbi:alpha/beta hydrolase [Rhodococcus sp. NPDC003318]|uniref:alpha/beta hydrolase n=1 Tax=Rhodococcus sp. NPDC003318 TaxID=3364503 RepID=UPI003689A985